MSRTSAVRRGAAALGVSGLIALSLAGPAAARQDPGTGDLHQPYSTVPANPTIIITRDDNALEYLQIGGGLLAGMALAGAGAALVSRRSHAEVRVA